jgi:hypothetical protein
MSRLSLRLVEELLKIAGKACGFFQMEAVAAPRIDSHRHVFEPVHGFVGVMNGDDGVPRAPEERDGRQRGYLVYVVPGLHVLTAQADTTLDRPSEGEPAVRRATVASEPFYLGAVPQRAIRPLHGQTGDWAEKGRLEQGASEWKSREPQQGSYLAAQPAGRNERQAVEAVAILEQHEHVKAAR